MEINKQKTAVRSSASEAVIDQGLRSYMLKVYNYMTSGIFLTGIVSLFLFKFSGGYNIQLTSAGITGTNAFGDLIFKSPLISVEENALFVKQLLLTINGFILSGTSTTFEIYGESVIPAR